MSAKLALIQSKMRLQHNSLPFLPLASCFSTLWLGMRRNQNFEFLDEKVTYFFWLFYFWNFFCLSFFSCSFLFAAVIDLLLGLLAVKKLLRKHHRDRQFLIWSSQFLTSWCISKKAIPHSISAIFLTYRYYAYIALQRKIWELLGALHRYMYLF